MIFSRYIASTILESRQEFFQALIDLRFPEVKTQS